MEVNYTVPSRSVRVPCMNVTARARISNSPVPDAVCRKKHFILSVAAPTICDKEKKTSMTMFLPD